MKKIVLSLFLVTALVACGKSDGQEKAPNTDDIAIISTDLGDMYVLLYDGTPKHKANFLKLAKEGFYDSTTFHRVIPEFMIQGGDPNSKDANLQNDGQGGPGYTIDAEINPKFIHKKGALAAARLGDQQNPEKKSSGSQFYIVQGKPSPSLELDQMLESQNNMARQNMIRQYVQSPEHSDVLDALRRNQSAGRVDSVQSILAEIEPLATEGFVPRTYTPEERKIYSTIGGTPFLDGGYTVFGEVIQGLDVLDAIAGQETGQGDQPVKKITMTVRVETMDRDEITKKFGYQYN